MTCGTTGHLLAWTRPLEDIGVGVEKNGDEGDAVTGGTADLDTVKIDVTALRRLVVSTVLDLDAAERDEEKGPTSDDGALRDDGADQR
jgi:hypothetical protein